MSAPARGALLVLLLALAAYANSLPNGFAYDDEGVIVNNPTVTAGDWRGATARPWWPDAVGSAGLWRPLTSASFALEWRMGGGSPLLFHALNVVVHAGVSLLVYALLLALPGLPGAAGRLGAAGAALPAAGASAVLPAAAGAVVFAVHPVHTEAVANVVGRAELYAALFYLMACLLYLRGAAWTRPALRAARLAGVAAFYLLALASKEIAVTLPAALVLLGVMARPSASGHRTPSALRRLFMADAPLWVALAGVLGVYLVLRWSVLGTPLGDQAAPIFQLIGPEARLLTAVAVWAQYARLLLFPLDLASDYDPGVLFPSEYPGAAFFAGALVMLGLTVAALRSRRALPLVAGGVAFFVLAVLPVSNLLFATGTVLAERTLYLPSVGLAMLVAGAGAWAGARGVGWERAFVVGVAAVVLAFTVRTALRNPTWMSTFTVQETLAREHPESWRAFRAQALGLARVGEMEAADEAWRRAVMLAPTNVTLLLEAARHMEARGEVGEAEELLRRAVALVPDHPNPYEHLGLFLLRRGRAREAHAVAVEGLRRARPGGAALAGLRVILAEAYMQLGAEDAAAWAREAAGATATGAPPHPTASMARK